MRMQSCTCVKETFFFAIFIFDKDGTCKNLVYKRLFSGSVCLYLDCFCVIETADNLFAGTISKSTQEDCTKNLLFAVNLCKNELFFLVNFKFKP